MKKKLIILSTIISISIILAIIVVYICFKQSSKEVTSNNTDNNNVYSNTTFEDIDTDIANSLNHTLQSQLELNEDFVFLFASRNNKYNDIVMYYTYKQDFNVTITLNASGSIKSFGISTHKMFEDEEQIGNLLNLLLNKDILILTSSEKYFILKYAFDNSMPVYNTKDLFVTVSYYDKFYALSVTKKN